MTSFRARGRAAHVRPHCSRGRSSFAPEASEGRPAREHVVDRLGDCRVAREFGAFARHPSLERSDQGSAFRLRAAKRVAAAKPLISRSIAKSASMRLTAFPAIGGIGGAFLPRRVLTAMSANSKNLRRAWLQHRAWRIGPGLREDRGDCSPRTRRLAERQRSRPNAAQDAHAFDRARHRTAPPEDPCRRTAGHRARRPKPGRSPSGLCEDGDRSVVAMQPLGGQHMPLDQRVQGLERRGAGADLSASVDRLRSIPSRA
jgi:hypothetical protein